MVASTLRFILKGLAGLKLLAGPKALPGILNFLPRGHIVAASGVAVATALVLVLVPSEQVEAKRTALEIPLSVDSTAFSQQAGPAAADEDLDWREERIRRGDTLTTVFRRLSLGVDEVHAVAAADEDTRALTKLQIGDTVAVAFAADGELTKVKYSPSPTETYLFEAGSTETGFTGHRVVIEPERMPVVRGGQIRSSLSVDGEAIGLSHAQILELAGIFAWDIDFALDLRQGDTFSVLYDEEFLDGEKIGNGDILAARFTNQGTTYTAVRFVEPDGTVGYYTPEGRPMRKAFLRAPLDFTRVSSNFNPRRLHPIFKTVRPHNGIDYSAPRGTPIYAAGNGKVVTSGFNGPSGNYVVIQHGGRYTTKYLHLDRRSVKAGETVKQGEVIGTVGSTGYATGPHLHYEFLVDGAHRNPGTVVLPKAEPIAARLKASFDQASIVLLAKLDNQASAPVALRD
ncbi:MAG TPA: peptidoglycan DD-metalloendopeptidase family protein [Porticoccaceae bacterium]|nr:peptidoglycan DD-metalloendopeptidase family protein [Porticoccaceae bacterium]